MRILHVIPSLSPKQGGPSFALPLIARSLVASGVSVDVATTDDDGLGHRIESLKDSWVERDGYRLRYFPKQTEFYKCSWPFRKWMKGHIRDYDLVHVHAVFSFTSNCASRQARRRKVPYIIRPLGVLNRWGMENRRRWIKSLSFRLIEEPLLRDAAAIHYTSHAEQREAEQTGVQARSAMIPLGIDIDQFAKLPSPELFYVRCPQAAGREVVLFLSRIDPKKGLDLLLPAFAQVKQEHPQALLVIAGNGEAGYVESLQKEADRLGLRDDVLWPGFLGGIDKLSAFAAATVYVLPSHSENFGIALVEALAAGLPCVTTTGVAASEELAEHGAGIVVAAESSAIARALVQLLHDEARRLSVATNAQRFARERFSMLAMGTGLKRLYSELLQAKQLETANNS
jgi:glycosyltransferase involved in cell wall biosynthesis